MHSLYKSRDNDIYNIRDAISCNDSRIGFSFYGYCPRYNKTINHENCLDCKYMRNNYCTYRFIDFFKENSDVIKKVKYDRDNRIKTIEFYSCEQYKKVHFDKLPYYTNSLLYYASTLKNVRVVRFFNVRTKIMVQMNSNNLNILNYDYVCKGRLCSPGKKCNSEEREIYNFNNPEWLLIWFV